jgi:hypothetical protein
MTSSKVGRRALAVLVLSTIVLARYGAAAPPDAGSCDPDTAARLRFLEERLDARRTYADWWWKGWTGFYGIGTVVETVQAATEDDEGKQADYAVSAGKAAFGTVRLALYPPTARQGADPIRAVPLGGPGACRERLDVGERLLRENAHESESRWDWKRHLANVGINVAGGLIVAEGFDESDGWISAGVGIAVGEAMTFSHPWEADDDLAEYQRRFEGPAAPRVSWHVLPWQGGARFMLAF